MTRFACYYERAVLVPLEERVRNVKEGGLEAKLPEGEQKERGPKRTYASPGAAIIDGDGNLVAGSPEQYGLASSFKDAYERFLDSEAGGLLKAFLKKKGYEGSLEAQLYAIGEPEGGKDALAWRMIPEQGRGPQAVGLNPRHLDGFREDPLRVLAHEAIHAVVRDEKATQDLTEEYLGLLQNYLVSKHEKTVPLYREDVLEDCERVAGYGAFPLRGTGRSDTGLKYAA